ncbi:probable apyrase 6 [Punica granatum]|uniref:apyrase n=2 Tax=Punica granatum TaxID=22663 RepID=A0A2I0I8J8_PUNGR|nr:probable apyrase 6 [Punica granatum]PKI40301.1 hypothetical protein CRG98_039326 [Punica granatum]
MDYSNLLPRSSSAAYFPPHRTQLHPRMHSFSSTLSPNPRKSPSKFLLLLVPLFTAPFLFFLLSTARSVHRSSKFTDPKPTFFGAAINVGLYSSRIRVFEFVNEGELPTVAVDGSAMVRAGLAHFGEEPERAGREISEMVEFAEGRVPVKEWSSTRVVLLVSGGLDRVSSKKRDRIIKSFRQVLRKSRFLFKDEWVREIQGGDEGVYAWIAVNYVLGSLRGEPRDTTGVIELGGGNLQVAYALRDATALQSSRIIRLFGTNYNLYTQSFPQFGQDTVWESLNELHKSKELTSSSQLKEMLSGNPCVSRGYERSPDASDTKLVRSNTSGNFPACKAEASALLKARQDKCSQPHCKILQPSFLKLQDKANSLESFFYTNEIFGIFSSTGLSDLRAAGQHYCEDDWNKLKSQHNNVADRDLLRYCFSSAYAVALLHDRLGIPLTGERIETANRTGNIIPLDWTLGAYIVQTMVDPVYSEQDNFGQIVGNESVTYFSLFAILLVVVLAIVLIFQWRKPQFKTIYDLEKGHYIVTRVPR